MCWFSNKSLLALLWTVLAVIDAQSTSSQFSCQKRNFGKGSVVCVCSESVPCNPIGVVESPEEPSEAFVYQSSAAGDRFHFSKITVKPTKRKNCSRKNELIIDAPNIAKGQQKIIGFGGAFTDAAAINIKKLSRPLQKSILKSYFSRSGLNYNLGRINMGGCDFSVRDYTYDDVVGDVELEHFALADEDLNYKIPVIKDAIKFKNQDKYPDKLYLFGSPWSPPGWMKTTNRTKGGGYLIGQPGGKYYKSYAKYFVKFLDAYKDQGLNIWGITIDNEALMAGCNFNWAFQSLCLTPTLERDFVKMDLGPALWSNGYKKIQLMNMDDQRNTIQTFADVMFSDPEASKYVSGIAVHWYYDTVYPPDNLTLVKKLWPEKFILNTEACAGFDPRDKEKVSLGNWTRAELYAHDIIEDLQHSVAGWVDWNIVLDSQGGPNWVGNYVDAAVIIDIDKQEYYLQPMFFAMGHFSKFIQRGSRRAGWKNVDNLEMVSFVRPDKNIVVVVLNKGTKPERYTIRTTNGYFSKHIAAKAIQTVLVHADA